MTSTNDVHSDQFISHCDLYFTSAYREDQWGRYRVWDKDQARSMLATTRPLRCRAWCSGRPSIKSPVAVNLERAQGNP